MTGTVLRRRQHPVNAQCRTTIEEVVRVTQTDEVMAQTTEDAEPVGPR